MISLINNIDNRNVSYFIDVVVVVNYISTFPVKKEISKSLPPGYLPHFVSPTERETYRLLPLKMALPKPTLSSLKMHHKQR